MPAPIAIDLPEPRGHTADEVKSLLSEAALTPAAAAQSLDLGQRTLWRYWSDGCPHHVWLAICQLRDLRIRQGLAQLPNRH